MDEEASKRRKDRDTELLKALQARKQKIDGGEDKEQSTSNEGATAEAHQLTRQNSVAKMAAKWNKGLPSPPKEDNTSSPPPKKDNGQSSLLVSGQETTVQENFADEEMPTPPPRRKNSKERYVSTGHVCDTGSYSSPLTSPNHSPKMNSSPSLREKLTTLFSPKKPPRSATPSPPVRRKKATPNQRYNVLTCKHRPL